MAGAKLQQNIIQLLWKNRNWKSSDGWKDQHSCESTDNDDPLEERIYDMKNFFGILLIPDYKMWNSLIADLFSARFVLSYRILNVRGR